MSAVTSSRSRRARRFGIQRKLTALFVLLSTVPLLVLGSWLFRIQIDGLKAGQLRDLKNDVAELREKAEAFLSHIEAETRLLSRTSEIQRFLDSLERKSPVPEPLADAVTQELLALLKGAGSYVRVNLLDRSGQELVAVVFDGDGLNAVPRDRLAPHPFHFYAYATAEMQPGQIKFSPCEIPHHQTGRIVPAIDCILPLFDEQNSRTAILVVSVDAAKFFALFDARRYPTGAVLVVSADGHYLYHSQKKTDWNRLLALQEEKNLFHQYPRAMVNRILSGEQGTITDDPSRVVAYAPLLAASKGDDSRHFIIADVPTQTVFQAVRPLQALFIVGLLAIGVLSVLCGHLMARRFLRPIQELIVGTQVLRAGHLDYTLCVQTRDEIQDLVDSFNDMVVHWREKRGLEDKMRQFITDASHELRTPLAVLRGEVELGLKSEPVSSRSHEILVSCAIEIDRLSRLVDTLLLLSNGDAERKALDLKRINPARVLEETAEQARVLAENKGLEVVTVKEREIDLVADEMRLRQLLLSLVDNAVKFTPRGGRITLSCRSVEGRAEFVVSDTGIGIESKDLPHIFDRFYRANRGGPHAGSSFGLGLTICKWIVDSHRATLDVVSTPGKGSAFTVRFPLACIE